jgi:hypothetical protein
MVKAQDWLLDKISPLESILCYTQVIPNKKMYFTCTSSHSGFVCLDSHHVVVFSINGT